MDDPGLGRVVALNLTPGGPVARYTDAQIAKVRHAAIFALPGVTSP